VFTAEKPESPSENKEWGVPGTGFNCDLWVVSRGGVFHRLTDYPLQRPYRAVIHPTFSHDGTKLLWAERIGPGESFGGEWVLKIADFSTVEGRARLVDAKTLTPGNGPCFYESHDFSPDDRYILFSGNLLKGQPATGLDIYEMELSTGRITRLTATKDDWDEHAHYSPDGSRIIWMSSTGLSIQWGDTRGHSWRKFLKTELWIMKRDGTNQTQLTFFNTPGHPHNKLLNGNRFVVSDSAWSPDGRRIAALVAYETPNGDIRASIVMLQLN